MNAADQKCIVNSIDKYSDNELLALNKDFAKDAKEPSTDAGKKFQGEMTNCARGTMKETGVDSLKKSFPDITATQIDCANASIDKLSADEFSKMVSGGGGEDFGAKMAQDCKIGT